MNRSSQTPAPVSRAWWGIAALLMGGAFLWLDRAGPSEGGERRLDVSTVDAERPSGALTDEGGTLAPAPSAEADSAAGAQSTLGARSESDFMQQLRLVAQSDPARTVALSRQGDAAYPSGEAAAERWSLRVQALVALGDISSARAEATKSLRRFPGQYADEVRRLTGIYLAPTAEDMAVPH